MIQTQAVSTFDLLMLNKPYHAVLLLFILCGSPVFANSDFDTFQLHGFVNQGYFLSSHNNVNGKSSSNHGSLGLTEIGINASIRPFSQLGFAVQGIYRKAGALSDEAQIDFALLDWTFYNTGDTQAGLRLGRIKNPIGFYNETRDMAFTRPSIVLPQGIYYERLRDLYLSSDGAQFYYNQSSAFGEFSLQANIGKPMGGKNELEYAFFTFDAPGQLKAKTSKLVKLAYESHSGATRFAMTYIDLDLDYKEEAYDILNPGDIAIDVLIFSAQQRVNNLTLTAEYLIQDNVLSDFGFLLPDSNATSISYYLEGAYQVSTEIQLSLRYDALYINEDDKNGALYSAMTGMPRHSAFTKGSMVGLSWVPSHQWMIRTEYHRISGSSTLSRADNTDMNANKKHWDLFALQLSYRF